jgi:single-stranded-DNA-specific exonuclease
MACAGESMSRIPVRRIWQVPREDRAQTTALAEGLGLPRLAAHLLMQRGITTLEAARVFLRPMDQSLSDPYLLTDMDRAVDRLTKARHQGERVMVLGDYDVDGLSATAIMQRGLVRFGIVDCSYLIPHRMLDGYGMQAEHIRAAKEQQVSLVVTVDNGISAFEAAAAAASCGIDLIITDHHRIDGKLPEACAVVNPQREGAGHPLAHASGALVALKVVQALEGRVPEEDLDLAALGVVADVMPLHGENRVVVAQGLRQLRKPRVGLMHLARLAQVELANLTAENIAFGLAPRINACGRLGDGMVAMKLLLTSCEDEASAVARRLHEFNEERRSIERQIFDDALELMEHTDGHEHVIVLAKRGWHQGVIGVVASRLLQRFCRPVLLLGIDEAGVGRGSARGTGAVDLGAAFSQCQQWLVKWGGHRAAAGLTILEGDVAAFASALRDAIAAQASEGDPFEQVPIDGQVGLAELTPPLLQTLALLEPYGHANPQPVLCSYGVDVVPHSMRELRGGHLRCAVKQDSRVFTAIGFSMFDGEVCALEKGPVDIAFTPQFNTWRGETTIQLVLKDLRASAADG